MPSHFKKLFRTLLSFIIAGVFLYLAFRGTNFSDIWKSLQRVDYLLVLLMFPVGITSHWIRAVRWRYLLAPIKEKTSTRNLFSAVMIGYLFNNILPRVGEVVRAYAIGRSESVSKTSALGTVVVERILDMVTFSLVLCSVVVLSPKVLLPFTDNVDAVRPFFLVGSLASLIFFILLFLKGDVVFKLVGFVKPIVPRRFRDPFDRLVQSFLDGFAVAKMRQTFLPIIGLSLLIWSLYASALYFALLAFHDLAHLGLGIDAAIVLLTASSIAYILPAPGAMGTYHSFLTLALVQLYGADSATALSYSIVTHEVGYFMTTGIGLYYFIKDQFRISEAGIDVGTTA
ncbi:MAG TPA: hypothetical protein DCP63_04180 [Bacteroidetes bacterium]|nr:hypothetical protein [Bacteroidota bacterium]